MSQRARENSCEVKPNKLPEARENTSDKVVASFNWIWVVEKVAQVFGTNTQQNEAKPIKNNFRYSIENFYNADLTV